MAALPAAVAAPPARMSAYPHLFSPIRIGPRTLRNRIVHASISTLFAERQQVTQRLIDYYVNRARGGAAMLVTEPLASLHWHTAPSRVAVRSGENAAALARWAEAVEEAGGCMLGQIQDGGRGHRAGNRNDHAFGASPLPDDISWTVPHALETDAIERMIAEFVAATRALADAGFAGCEISAGHGHLFHQFMSRRSNRREDRFGGDLDGRTRLLRELILGIRQECGAGFIIGVKLPGADGVPGSIDLDEAAAITRLVHATHVPDYITYCWGTHAETLHEHLPDLHRPRLPYVDAIHALGQHAPGTPIGALGLITDPNEGERIIRDGLADLVMLGRPLVTDAAWGIKAEQGREAQIRYCVSCNTCWQVIIGASAIRCDNNPRVGTPDEADWVPARVTHPRRVVVVGAGVAGLEAAWVAAARGHAVTVFGGSGEVGGKTRLHSLLPGGEGLSSVYDYQALRAAREGVVFRHNQMATYDEIVALAPDLVVLATGSTPAWPDFLPHEYRAEGIFPDLRETVARFAGTSRREPGTAVVWDEDHGAFTYAAAELLCERFERVVILTPRERIASDAALVTRQGAYARLYRRGCEIVTSVRPLATSRFEEGEVSYANIFSGREATIGDVALFTHATQRLPNDALAAPLRAAGLMVTLIGDCWAPRSLLVATTEGHRAGLDA